MTRLVFSPQRLRSARITSRQTLEQAAATAGVAVRTLSRAELGEGTPGANVLGALAGVYDVPVDEFFHVDDCATSASAGVETGDGPESAKKRAAAKSRRSVTP